MKLSVILPCHNEEQAIPSVLPQLIKQKKWICHELNLADIEILVVDDGSTDQSLKLLENYKTDIQIISFKKNQGYGCALKTGFKAVSGELIAFYDLDGTCQAEDLIPLVRHLRQNQLGLVCGQRLSPSSKMPALRHLGNALYRNLASWLLKTPINDACSGYRVFRSEHKEFFCQHLPHQLNFSLAMTILFIRSGGRYGEVEIQYKERLGSSKLVPVFDGPKFLWTLLKTSLHKDKYI